MNQIRFMEILVSKSFVCISVEDRLTKYSFRTQGHTDPIAVSCLSPFQVSHWFQEPKTGSYTVDSPTTMHVLRTRNLRTEGDLDKCCDTCGCA